MSAAVETIAEVLNRIPECQWMRIVSHEDETCDVFGFTGDELLILHFKGLDDATLVSWVSSASEQDRASIEERLGVQGGRAQFVADVFGPLVPSAVRR